MERLQKAHIGMLLLFVEVQQHHRIDAGGFGGGVGTGGVLSLWQTM